MKITEKVHALKHTFFIPVNQELKLERFVYSFVIFGERNIYLIDSGVADSGNTILDYIRQNGYSISDIKTLILTHSHPDHIGSARNIKEKSNCEVLAHEGEKEWIENIEKQFSDRPVPGFKSFVSESVKIDKLIKDNDLVELEEGLSIKVIHTPGHSAGSISLLFENEGVLICGDCLLLPGSLPIYENVVTAVASIKRLQQIVGVRFLLSSWDEPAIDSGIMAKMNQSINYFKIIHKTISEIDEVKTLDPMSLCKQVINKMGLPSVAVNPLVAKSFQSNVKVLDKDIFN